MANTLLKISELEATHTAPDSSFIPIDDGTLTKKITVEEFNATGAQSAYRSAVRAEEAKDDAFAYKNIANEAMSQAQSAASQAADAQAAAETAQGLAEAAQSAAEGAASQAAGYASTMSGYAGQVGQYVAQTSADANRAETAATLAEGYANAVAGVAERAEAAASTSSDKALDSEAWARGTRNGVPVGPEDETYENNAKYYADQADTTGLVVVNGVLNCRYESA